MIRSASKTQKILNVYGIILILWSIYRWKFSMPEWFDEFLAKPLVFVLPVYWVIVRIEGKNFFGDIWLHTRKIWADIYIGVLLGCVFIVSALSANFVKTGTFGITGTFEYGLVLTILMTLATATTEETLTRGFILKRFFEESRSPYLASFNASILFLILHIPILFTMHELRGNILILFLMTDFVLSLINSFLYLDRKNLVAPILIHAFYNMAVLMYI